MNCNNRTKNFRAIFQNIADSSAITATPNFVDIAGLDGAVEGSGMQRQEGAFVARTDGLPAVQQIFIELPNPRLLAYDLWVLYGTFSENATISYKFYSGAAQTGTVLLESAVPEAIYTQPSCLDEDCNTECGSTVISTANAPISASISTCDKLKQYNLITNAFEPYNSILIEIRDAGNSAGYFDIQRLIGGFMYQPTYNATYPFSFAPNTSTTQELTAGGGVISFPEAAWRELSFEIQLMSDIEVASFYNQILQTGLNKDFYIDLKPYAVGSERQLFAFRAKFMQMPKMAGNGLNRNTWQISLREVK